MAGKMTFQQHAKYYLDEYLAFRKYGNTKVKKRYLLKWISAVIAKETVTVEDVEAMLITLYSEERKYAPLVVEALANQNILAIEETKREIPSRRLTIRDNGL